MTRADQRLARRLAVFVAIVAVAVGIALAVREAGDRYEVHLRFESAGQLIEGNVVEVAGVRVGRITKLELTDDGLADVKIEIQDERYRPLHRGTSAGIGTVGASGVTNRYVTLSPGPTNGTPIRDGGVLGLSETRPIVDIDQLLNAFTPPVREDLQARRRTAPTSCTTTSPTRAGR